MSNKISINVTIYSGRRTPVKVEAYCHNVNDKRLGGVGSNKTITDDRLARYIEESVTTALKTYFEQHS